MGWFDRKPVWDGKAFLTRVATLAGVADAVATETALTGTLHGFPLVVAIGDGGDVERIVLHHAPGIANLILHAELDPDDEGDPRRISLVGDLFVDGPHAERQAAAFWALPREIQERLPGTVRRMHITEVRHAFKRLELEVHRDPEDVAERARWLADLLVLGADLARGRGAVPPHARAPRELAPALAQQLAARIPGAAIVAREDGIAIQWRDATIVLAGDDLLIEVPGEAGDVLDELAARHEVVSITSGDHLIALGICELDEVTDGGARVHAIATELASALLS